MTTQGMVVSWPSRSPQAARSSPSIGTDFAHISQLALVIEADPSRIEEWYQSVRINELGGMTAKELVMRGEARRVMDFLHAICSGERG